MVRISNGWKGPSRSFAALRHRPTNLQTFLLNQTGQPVSYDILLRTNRARSRARIVVEFMSAIIIVRAMRRLLNILFVLALSVCAMTSVAASGRVLKVLPHFLDLRGRHTLSPSLFDRDAYQAQLRQHPEQRSGVRFDVLWKGRSDPAKPLKLRIKLRGMARGDLPRTRILERDVTSRSNASRWTGLPLVGDDYQQLGEITAWHVSLLDGDRVLSEQQSFLW